MLETYSTVHRHISIKLNSQSSTSKTTHLKQLLLNTFVIYTNFKPVKFSHKHKPHRLGPLKHIQHLSDVTYKLMSQDGSTFHTYRNHICSLLSKRNCYFPVPQAISIYFITYQ